MTHSTREVHVKIRPRGPPAHWFTSGCASFVLFRDFRLLLYHLCALWPYYVSTYSFSRQNVWGTSGTMHSGLVVLQIFLVADCCFARFHSYTFHSLAVLLTFSLACGLSCDCCDWYFTCNVVFCLMFVSVLSISTLSQKDDLYKGISADGDFQLVSIETAKLYSY